MESPEGRAGILIRASVSPGFSRSGRLRSSRGFSPPPRLAAPARARCSFPFHLQGFHPVHRECGEINATNRPQNCRAPGGQGTRAEGKSAAAPQASRSEARSGVARTPAPRAPALRGCPVPERAALPTPSQLGRAAQARTAGRAAQGCWIFFYLLLLFF